VGSSDAFTIWRMEGNQRIIAIWLENIPHGAHWFRFRATLLLFWSIRNFQSLRRPIPESDWAFNPLDEKTYESQFVLSIDALELFSHANFLHVGGWWGSITTGRGVGNLALELQLYWLNRVRSYAASNKVWSYLLGWICHLKCWIVWDDLLIKI